MKRTLALVLAGLLLAVACASAETLRIGMECDYAPFNWTQAEPSDTAVPIASGGYADGYDVRIAKIIADKLGISKIYLEQVFSLLKRAGLVSSAKGAQGGYLLGRSPKQITAYEILCAIEHALFEQSAPTVADSAPEIETAMQSYVFRILDIAVKDALDKITLDDLVLQSQFLSHDGYMFFL